MKKIYKFLTIVVLLFASLTAKAQNDGIALTLLPHLSYNNFYNPGIRIDQKVVFGVGISNVGLSVYNSSVRYNDLYKFENGVPTALDLNNFIQSLEEHDNHINTDFSLDLVRLGAKFGRFFVDVNWRLRANTEFHYSRDFLGFFINGNGNYLGPDNPANFSIGLDSEMFSEFAVGLQYNINDKLTVGIRPKLLCGIANIMVNDDDTYIYTDENNYEMTADLNLNIKASSALDANINRIADVRGVFSNDSLDFGDLLNFKENYGWGIDFGASYVFNDHFGVAVGVYDLGFIQWKDVKEKHIRKDNVVVNDALIDDVDDILSMDIDFTDIYQDFIEDVLDDDILYNGNDYRTSLKTRVMLQGYYELCPIARFTAIGQMYYVNNQYRPSLTLAYSGSFFRFLNFTTSYTMSKYSTKSVGAGVSMNFGPLNVYAVTDNIMILTKINASTTRLVTSYDAVNVRFGLVFTMGRNK